MPEVNAPISAFQFGVFELDLKSGELRKQGVKVRLQAQPLQVLATLLEQAGTVVTKDELRGRIWAADTFVDFDHGLHSAITRLREALGDSSESPRFIETLPRRGYRFAAPVRAVCTPVASGAEEEIRPPASGDRLRWFSRSVFAGMLGGALLLGLVLSLNAGGIRRWLLRQSNPELHSLAVLPLENLSGDPSQEYFADGMTDALITNLSKISALRVISRTSAMHYKGTKKGLLEIATELNVDGVVEGSVTRSGNRVRITAQLVQTATDQHLWAETYERDLGDIVKLQNEVAQSIAQQVRIRLTPQQEAQLGTAARVNSDAYEVYLRARYFWNQRTESGLWKSIELFQHAIDIDPNSALPYAGLADAYLVLDGWTLEAAPLAEWTPKARAAAERALQLDPTLAEAHTVLAGVKHGSWDWDGAGFEYRRSIELNSNYAHAHHWYSQYLCELGRFDEGVEEAKLAHTLDPLNLLLGVDVGMRLYWARRYQEAIAPIRKTLELDSNFAVAHRFLGQVYEQNGMCNEAIAELRRAAELSKDNPIDMGALGHAYTVSGQRRQGMEILEKLRQLSQKRYVSSFEFALIYAGLGERDRAMQWLDRAFREHSAWMLHLKVDPRLDPLRSDPRFEDLMRRVGLQP
ncbi:MAG TPA: winged helix-turn-helix domain-containing protein [Acidobacteriota bacterium]|nr:winged helix-turn-helix domain-containing protein [Acidobacteriota bacterium]